MEIKREKNNNVTTETSKILRISCVDCRIVKRMRSTVSSLSPLICRVLCSLHIAYLKFKMNVYGRYDSVHPQDFFCLSFVFFFLFVRSRKEWTRGEKRPPCPREVNFSKVGKCRRVRIPESRFPSVSFLFFETSSTVDNIFGRMSWSFVCGVFFFSYCGKVTEKGCYISRIYSVICSYSHMTHHIFSS